MVLPAWPRRLPAGSLLTTWFWETSGWVRSPRCGRAGPRCRRIGRGQVAATHERDANAREPGDRRSYAARDGTSRRTGTTTPRRPQPAAAAISIRCRRGSRFLLRTSPPHAGRARSTDVRSIARSRMSRLAAPGCSGVAATHPAARGPAASAASLAAASFESKYFLALVAQPADGDRCRPLARAAHHQQHRHLGAGCARGPCS